MIDESKVIVASTKKIHDKYFKGYATLVTSCGLRLHIGEYAYTDKNLTCKNCIKIVKKEGRK